MEVLMHEIEYHFTLMRSSPILATRTRIRKTNSPARRQSLSAFGFTAAGADHDETSTLLAGHCRLEAAKFLASSKYPPSGCVA